PASRRSNTTRTARPASACSSTATARSATCSCRTACGAATWSCPGRAPQRGVGGVVGSGPGAEAGVGTPLPLANIPLGTTIHNIELIPGKGGQIVRSAGVSAQLLAKKGDSAQVLLPSGEVRRVSVKCMATIGQVSNVDHENQNLGK